MSLYTETVKKYKDLDQTVKVLDARKKETYKLNGIETVDFDDIGNLQIGFVVQESDEFGYGINSSEYVKNFFTPKHVWNHFVSMLNLPTRLIDYVEAFKRLPYSEREICLSNFSDSIRKLMNHRIQQQQESNRYKDHYLTVVDDIFGKFPRRISSGIYRPYEDRQALLDLDNNLGKINEVKNTNYTFDTAILSPYRSTFTYTDPDTKSRLQKKGDEIAHGITNINSEAKDNSNEFQYLIMRLQCENGLTSTFSNNDIRIRHVGDDFALRNRKAFIEIMKLGNSFAQMYYEMDKKSKTISNDWSDLMDIPSNILPMKNGDKQELIEIADKEGYDFDAYGLVQALTYKSSHNARTDNEIDNLNQKAVSIMKNIDRVNKWKPKRLTEKEEKEQKVIIDANFVNLNPE